MSTGVKGVNIDSLSNYMNLDQRENILCIFECSIRIICPIPGTWHDCSKVNVPMEEFCQNTKKTLTVENSCQRLLNNYISDCWTILPTTVEVSCQQLLKNCVSDCWTIVPATVEQSCRWMLKNYASDCWRIVLVTVKESRQQLLNNRVSDNWTIVPAAAG